MPCRALCSNRRKAVGNISSNINIHFERFSIKLTSLSAIDPTLIDGVRDQLAQDFARRVFDAVPELSDCIDFEARACTSAIGKRRFERASQLLYLRRRDPE
jgi:hypothetical protein